MKWVVRKKICNLFGALFSLLLVFPTVYMAMDRQLPVILTYGSIHPIEVQNGSMVKVIWHAVIMREFGDGWFQCQGTFYRRMIDSGGFIKETKPSPVQSYKLVDKITHEGDFSKDIIFPLMLPGPATYQIITTYWCNPVQKYILPIITHEETVKFMVRDIPLIAGPPGPKGEKGETGPKGEAGIPIK